MSPMPETTFWLSIVIAPLYIMYFHVGAPGRSTVEQYQASVSENTRKQYAEIGDLSADQPTMIQYLKEPKWVGVGQSIFKANCVSCHAVDGGGNVGPNLCDDNFKHVKQLQDIIKVINEGVAGGAMPAWGNRFSHKNDLILVSVYVASLRGSKPANPKAADGSPIAAWPTE